VTYGIALSYSYLGTRTGRRPCSSGTEAAVLVVHHRAGRVLSSARARQADAQAGSTQCMHCFLTKRAGGRRVWLTTVNAVVSVCEAWRTPPRRPAGPSGQGVGLRAGRLAGPAADALGGVDQHAPASRVDHFGVCRRCGLLRRDEATAPAVPATLKNVRRFSFILSDSAWSVSWSQARLSAAASSEAPTSSSRAARGWG